MANSLEQYAGDGITRNFAVPFSYLSKDHVFVTVNGIDTAFSWINPGQLRTDEAPATGTIVLVKRTTPPDQMVDFTDGSTLVETDLDTASLQPLYVAQEAADVIDMKLGVSETTGAFDAGGRRIENIGAPLNPNDAMPKAYGDAVLAAAAGHSGAASSSANAAQASAVLSTTQAGLSETSKVASFAARDKSQKWADEVENTPVETGKFSARHWAAKAAAYAAGVLLPAISIPDAGKALTVNASGAWSLAAFASVAQGLLADAALPAASLDAAREWTKRQRSKPIPLESSLAISADLAAGQNFDIASYAHNAVLTFTNAAQAIGQKGTITGRNDASAGRTLAYGAGANPIGQTTAPAIPSSASARWRVDYHVRLDGTVDFGTSGVAA